MKETNEVERVEPLALVIRGGNAEKVAAWACGKCRIIRPSEDDARRCCAPVVCECGVEVEDRYYTACRVCRDRKRLAERAEKERAELAAATVVPWEDAQDTMLYDSEHDRWLQKGEHPEDADEDAPTRYAWVGVPQQWRPSTDHFLDQLCDGDWHEDAADEVSAADLKELDDFLGAWSARVGIVSYFPDYKRVVLFDPAVLGEVATISTPES